jgi:hypothetical protein
MNFSGERGENRTPEILAQLQGFDASLRRATTAAIEGHHA